MKLIYSSIQPMFKRTSSILLILMLIFTLGCNKESKVSQKDDDLFSKIRGFEISELTYYNNSNGKFDPIFNKIISELYPNDDNKMILLNALKNIEKSASVKSNLKNKGFDFDYVFKFRDQKYLKDITNLIDKYPQKTGNLYIKDQYESLVENNYLILQSKAIQSENIISKRYNETDEYKKLMQINFQNHNLFQIRKDAQKEDRKLAWYYLMTATRAHNNPIFGLLLLIDRNVLNIDTADSNSRDLFNFLHSKYLNQDEVCINENDINSIFTSSILSQSKVPDSRESQIIASMDINKDALIFDIEISPFAMPTNKLLEAALEKVSGNYDFNYSIQSNNLNLSLKTPQFTEKYADKFDRYQSYAKKLDLELFALSLQISIDKYFSANRVYPDVASFEKQIKEAKSFQDETKLIQKANGYTGYYTIFENGYLLTIYKNEKEQGEIIYSVGKDNLQFLHYSDKNSCPYIKANKYYKYLTKQEVENYLDESRFSSKKINLDNVFK